MVKIQNDLNKAIYGGISKATKNTTEQEEEEYLPCAGRLSFKPPKPILNKNTLHRHRRNINKFVRTGGSVQEKNQQLHLSQEYFHWRENKNVTTSNLSQSR
jgi:hypothetical protein